MNYKGYSFRLNGVYKVENNKKLYSLEISQGTNQILKTDWIYKNEKRAFKDAKEMVNKNRFDTEIIRKNTNKENLKNDKSYKKNKRMIFAGKINSFANIIIIVSLILMLITYTITAFGISKLSENIFYLFGILFVVLGILMSLLMLFWGVFARGEYVLSDNQRKIYRFIWWFNLLYNKRFAQYNEQPFIDKKKGWYSSNVFIALFFEAFFAAFLIMDCVENNIFGLTFYGVISSCILLFINYIFSIVWEISDSKAKGEGFPYKKVFMPIFVIIAILLFNYIYSILKNI